MTRTEILFAPWAIRELKGARGAKWRRLVEQVAALPEDDPDSLAFQLTMIRLNNCLSCNALRFMERGGCARCAATNLGFCRDTEDGLIARYRNTRKEFSQSMRPARHSAKAT